MIKISYDDILDVFKTDTEFRRKNLTIMFCEDFEENYDKYDKKLEEYFFYEACLLDKFQLVVNFCNRRLVNDDMLNAGLALAVDANNFDIAYELILKGADPESNYYHAVKLAVKENAIKFLKKLNKMNISFKPCEKELFEIAIADENLDMLKYLTDLGLGCKKYYEKALRIAIIYRDKKLIHYFIKKGATGESCKYEYIKYIYS